jgi:hypothetical protein
VTKEQQRAELHRTIWRIANDLRGSVDGWDFKTYVLGMLFYRFISENLTACLNDLELKAGTAGFDCVALSDKDAEFGRAETVAEKGFYILPSELFENIRQRARSDEHLNETLERIFRHVEGSAVGTDSEQDLKGLFDDLDHHVVRIRWQVTAEKQAKQLGWAMEEYVTSVGRRRRFFRFTLHALRDRFADTAIHEWQYPKGRLLQQGAWEDSEAVRRFYAGVTDKSQSIAMRIHGWSAVGAGKTAPGRGLATRQFR